MCETIRASVTRVAEAIRLGELSSEAVVVRCVTSPEALPLGVQIVARPWREDVALAVAAYLDDVFGGWQEPSI